MRPIESKAGQPDFTTTRWSLVQAAGKDSSPQAREALDELCRAYWYPLYVFVRRRGNSSADAQDLTQAFVTQLLQRNDFQRADATRGRFRTFLLAALSNFLSNQRDYERAQKRGGGQAILTIDWAIAESRYGAEPAHEETAEQVFQRQWALALLDQVLDLLQQSYVESGNEKQFDALSPYLTGNQRGDLKHYTELADELGISHAAVKTAVSRMRKKYRDLLREAVAQTVTTPEDIEAEIRDLFAALRRPAG